MKLINRGIAFSIFLFCIIGLFFSTSFAQIEPPQVEIPFEDDEWMQEEEEFETLEDLIESYPPERQQEIRELLEWVIEQKAKQKLMEQMLVFVLIIIILIIIIIWLWWKAFGPFFKKP